MEIENMIEQLLLKKGEVDSGVSWKLIIINSHINPVSSVFIHLFFFWELHVSRQDHKLEKINKWTSSPPLFT